MSGTDNELKNCIYYEDDTSVVQRKTIRKTYPRKVSIIHYCTHPDSQITLEDTKTVVGGGKMLKCEGCRGKCQLDTPPDERAFSAYPPGAGQSKLS